MAEKKRSIKALKAYMQHNSEKPLETSDIMALKKEDDDGLTELCELAEKACKVEGIAY